MAAKSLDGILECSLPYSDAVEEVYSLLTQGSQGKGGEVPGVKEMPPLLGGQDWHIYMVLMSDHGQYMTENVKMWLRYIDDLFVVWQGTEKEAIDFVHALNVNSSN